MGLWDLIFGFLSGIFFIMAFFGISILLLNSLLPSKFMELKEIIADSSPDFQNEELKTMISNQFEKFFNRIFKDLSFEPGFVFGIAAATTALLFFSLIVIYLKLGRIRKTIRSFFNHSRNVSILYAFGFLVMALSLPPTVKEGMVPYDGLMAQQEIISPILNAFESWVFGFLLTFAGIFGILALLSWVASNLVSVTINDRRDIG